MQGVVSIEMLASIQYNHHLNTWEMKALRKLISLTLALVLALVSINVVFASDGSQKNGADSANRAIMKNLGIEDQVIAQYNADDITFLSDIIKTENLNKQQANNLVRGWIKRTIVSTNMYNTLSASDKNMADDYINNMIKEHSRTNSLSSTMGVTAVYSYSDLIDSNDNSGAHWQVKSTGAGFTKASGNVDFPSLTLNQTLPDAKKDVPYMHFGMYVDPVLGLDMGFQYIRNMGWRPYIYGYESGQPSIVIHGVYNQHDLGNTSTAWHLVARCIKYSTYDVYELTIVDRTTWDPSPAAGGQTLSYATATVRANSTYSNLNINKEVTLAFSSDASRLPNTGSSMTGANWSNAYLYDTAGSSILWGPTQTSRAVRKGKTQAFCNSVTVNSYTPWSADNVNINY